MKISSNKAAIIRISWLASEPTEKVAACLSLANSSVTREYASLNEAALKAAARCVLIDGDIHHNPAD